MLMQFIEIRSRNAVYTFIVLVILFCVAVFFSALKQNHEMQMDCRKYKEICNSYENELISIGSRHDINKFDSVLLNYTKFKEENKKLETCK